MKFMKTISFTLCFTSIVSIVGPTTTVLAEDNNIDITSNISQTRENLTFTYGNPGASYYEYTYDENGQHYKVVEKLSDSLDNVSSTTYILNRSTGSYDVNTVVNSKIENGEVIIEKIDASGNATQEIINPRENIPQIMSDGTTGEWNTEAYDSEVYLGTDTPIATIAQFLFLALGLYLAETIPAKLFQIATTYFELRSERAYQHIVYSYMLSSESQFVIVREAIDVKYYLDAAHRYLTDTFYAEYDGRVAT